MTLSRPAALLTGFAVLAVFAVLGWLALAPHDEPAPVEPRPTPPPATCAAARADVDYPRETEAGFGTYLSATVVDAAGSPVTNTRVRLWSPTSMKNSYTGPDGGIYVWTDAREPIAFDVDALVPVSGGARSGVRRIHAGTLTSTDRSAVLRLPVEQLVVATGRLVDELGRPMFGWWIAGRHEGEDRARLDHLVATRTDREGRFRLKAWTLDPVTLEAHSGRSRRSIVSRVVDVDNGETQLVLGPPGLGGYVTANDGGDVSGAVVRMRPIFGGAEFTASTDASGWFECTKVESSSRYEVRCELGSYVCAYPYECLGKFGDVELTLWPRWQVVEGRAVDGSGTPLRNSWLVFREPGGHVFTAMTSIDGTFLTTGAGYADYDIFLLSPGPDGRLHPGQQIGRCHGGALGLELRLPR